MRWIRFSLRSSSYQLHSILTLLESTRTQVKASPPRYPSPAARCDHFRHVAFFKVSDAPEHVLRHGVHSAALWPNHLSVTRIIQVNS